MRTLELIMRLWTMHPKYLDAQGLVALWREALLAQAVLLGRTRGYTHHPQLTRFRDAPSPAEAIATYLREVCAEADRRGYHFDPTRIGACGDTQPIPTTQGQLEYEWTHLTEKLRGRSPAWLARIETVSQPDPHPLFSIVPGPVAEWEVGAQSHRSETGRGSKDTTMTTEYADMTIREATAADAAPLLDYAARLFSENLPGIYRRATPTLEEEREFIRSRVEPDNSTLMLADLGGTVVGLVDFLGRELAEEAHSGIFALSVDQDHRGEGIGTALIGRLLAWAPKHGISRVEAHAWANNPGAIALYEGLGFEREGLCRGAIVVDGTAVDVVLLAWTTTE